MDAQTVQTYFRNNRHEFSEDFRLRLHRALSWLNRADNSDDLDFRFISLWIAFNAVYAKEFKLRTNTSERSDFSLFLQLISQLDNDEKIYHLVWQTFPSNIRILLDNQYIFQPFWDFHNGQISEPTWVEEFAKAKQRAHQALANKDTDTILNIVFERLYTLRNQIVHGGATHNSQVNRSQLVDGSAILSRVIPLILMTMMQHHDRKDWGQPFYPVVNGNT